jgi:hypothetical protein
MGELIFKKDNIKLGLVLGLIAPLISLVGYYYLRFSAFSFMEYISALRMNKPLLTGITIPCLLLNVALLTIYLNTKKDKTAIGIFAVTAAYAILALLVKFFG